MKVDQITGVGRTFGNNVSHSKRRTNRSWLPNLHVVKVTNPETGRQTKLKVSARTLRTLQKKGLA